jgi:hypothetical protein
VTLSRKAGEAPADLPAPDFVLQADHFCLYQSVTTQDIESMDIASIEVIKGAAAASLQTGGRPTARSVRRGEASSELVARADRRPEAAH